MTAGRPLSRIAAPFRHGVNAWYDREGGGRATQLFLLLFVAAWTAFQIVAFASIDLNPDLIEAYAWSRHPDAGYFKHPPLVGLVTAAWFAVFPAADWAFHLLAMANAALALYFTDLIARRTVQGDKRLLVLLLLLLTPFFHFHGQRFSTNQLLLSTWPIATYCFLRAFETRGALWSIAAGMTAGLAMLTKYYSVYLIAALVLAALSHPARWSYLKSPAPWISAAVGLALLTPHLIWLRTMEFGPFDYAYLVHGMTTTSALAKAGGYVLGAIGYAAIPCIAYALAVRPDRTTLRDAFWPADPDRRMLVVLLAAMLALPPLTAPLIGLQLSSLWTMSAFFLLPIVLLAPSNAVLPRPRAVAVAMVVAGLTVAALLAAPVVAWTNHVNGTRDGRAYYRLASAELGRQWRLASTQPLRIVLGGSDVGLATTFYHPDHPDAAYDFNIQLTPWITPERIKRDGWAVVCRAEDAVCISHATRRAAGQPATRRSEAVLTRRFLGRAGEPARFVFIVVPPQPGAAP